MSRSLSFHIWLVENLADIWTNHFKVVTPGGTREKGNKWGELYHQDWLREKKHKMQSVMIKNPAKSKQTQNFLVSLSGMEEPLESTTMPTTRKCWTNPEKSNCFRSKTDTEVKCKVLLTNSWNRQWIQKSHLPEQHPEWKSKWVRKPEMNDNDLEAM